MKDKPTICGVILAAGNGSRIGLPKLMLKINDKYFFDIVYSNLKKFLDNNILTIVNQNSASWLKNFFPEAEFIINHKPENGMISSIFLSIKSKFYFDGLLLVPVDHPYVKEDTYKKLIDSFYQNPESVIRPIHNSKKGHPIILPSSIYNFIPETDIDGGLNKILSKCNAKEILVNVDDEGILRNINFLNEIF